MLSTTFFIGLAAAGAAQVIRALAPVPLLMRKPLSCDLCMSWWGSFIGACVLKHDLLVRGTFWSHDGVVATFTFFGYAFAALMVSIIVLKGAQRLAVIVDP